MNFNGFPFILAFMEFKTFTAGTDDSGRRLDRVLSRIFENGNVKSGIFPLIRKGLVKVNEKKTSADYRVQSGDEISIASFLFTAASENSSVCKDRNSMDLNSITIFRNRHFLILNKPSGINVQPSKESKICLSQLVEEEYFSNKNNSLSFRPGPLHRIDRFTSGIVVFSQSLEGAKWFSTNMQDHNLSKTYLGITEGNYGRKTERYEDFLTVPDENGSGYSTVKISTTGEKKAITTAKFLGETEISGIRANLVEFSIETGRKHQIRAQSSHHGHPLLGDTAYGGTKLKDKMFYLHAWKLKFPQNDLELPLEITAPCDFCGELLQ